MSSVPTPQPWTAVLAKFEEASSPEGRRQTGRFTVEGFRLVERALNTGAAIEHILVGESAWNLPCERMQKLLKALASRQCSVVQVPDTVADRITEGRTFGAVQALVALPVSLPFPEWLATRVAQAPQAPQAAPLTLLVLEQMMDPGNVGALLRTAHAMGADALVAIGGSDPFHPRSARTSMGSIFRVPVFRTKTADELLTLLRQHRVCTIGAAIEASTQLPDVHFPTTHQALFMGNEGEGLSHDTRAQLDHIVSIPMSEAIDSLSVNAATAVILYAMRHQNRIHTASAGDS